MDDSLVTIMQEAGQEMEDAIFWMRVQWYVGFTLFVLCTISLVVIASQLERGASALCELVAQGAKKTIQEMPSSSPPPPMLHVPTQNKNVFHGEPTPPPKNRDDEDLEIAKWLS